MQSTQHSAGSMVQTNKGRILLILSMSLVFLELPGHSFVDVIIDSPLSQPVFKTSLRALDLINVAF